MNQDRFFLHPLKSPPKDTLKLHPVFRLSLCCSIYIVVSVSLERFLAVTRYIPGSHKVDSWQSPGRFLAVTRQILSKVNSCQSPRRFLEVTRQIPGSQKVDSWQSEGRFLAVTRQILGSQKVEYWQSQGRFLAVTRQIPGSHKVDS